MQRFVPPRSRSSFASQRLKFRDKIAGVGWICCYLISAEWVVVSFPISSNKFPVTQNEFNGIKENINLAVIQLMESLEIQIAGANKEVKIIAPERN